MQSYGASSVPLFALQNWADALSILIFALVIGLVFVPVFLQKRN
jgi:hypothetical protein